MEKHSEADKENRENRNKYINNRWEQLYGLEKDWGEKALRYLLMTNSGGAIATLSFIGASKDFLTITSVKIALVLFIVGIFLIGVSIAKTYHHMNNLFESYTKDVKEYYSNNKTWIELSNEDEERTKNSVWDNVCPYASFGCFIFGCILGSCALFSN